MSKGRKRKVGCSFDIETFEMIKERAIESILSKYLQKDIRPQEKIAMHRLLEELPDEIMKTVSTTKAMDTTYVN